MELRITAGSAKNKKLKVPNIPGYRAVQEVAKSSLFSIIGDKIFDAVCLDLFAGSGNLGIEALSRGAAWCDFVDSNKESVEAIKENIENCGFFEKSSVWLKKANKYLAATNNKYDLIFMDPFYNDLAQQHLLNLISKHLKDKGQLIYLHGTSQNIKDMVEKAKLTITDIRSYGNASFSIITTAEK
ncbi:MAG: RNA methyltransferase [Patescibacteria group bacterium]|nr:MAG: RNA methyltransferase [Patescibacteria group bacterium]